MRRSVSSGTVRQHDTGRILQGLVDHTVPLGQSEQGIHFAIIRVSIEIEMQTDMGQSDRHDTAYNRSTLAAKIKSLAVSPSILCVQTLNPTFPQLT